MYRSEDEILVHPSDLESEFEDAVDELDSDENIAVNYFNCYNDDSDISSDWEAEDNIPLASIKTNSKLQSISPSWTNDYKPKPLIDFKHTSGLPNFAKYFK